MLRFTISQILDFLQGIRNTFVEIVKEIERVVGHETIHLSPPVDFLTLPVESIYNNLMIYY